MQSLHFGYLAIAFTALLGDAEAQTNCSDSEISMCWIPLNDLPDHLTWSTVVPTLSEQNMRQHCQLFHDVEDCLEGLQSHCNVIEESSNQGAVASYHFLCDETFSQYLVHRECFTNPDIHVEGALCNETLHRNLAGIDSNRTQEFRNERVCQYANDYLDCVENAVTVFCGRRAAVWQRELDSRGITPLLTIANCEVQDSDDTASASRDTTMFIAIICVSVFFALIVILIIAILVLHRSNKDKRSVMQQETSVSYHADNHNGTNGGHVIMGSTRAITTIASPRGDQHTPVEHSLYAGALQPSYADRTVTPVNS